MRAVAYGQRAARAEEHLVVERDTAGGDGKPLHTSYRAFYYEMLAQLDAKRWGQQLAAAYAARGNRAAVTRLVAESGSGCPGYLRSPDLGETFTRRSQSSVQSASNVPAQAGVSD